MDAGGAAGDEKHLHVMGRKPHFPLFLTCNPLDLGSSTARAGLAQIPDESTLSAAARRVFHRAEPGKGLIGPGPALAPPPFEGAPVWAAFPELMATGPRAASATFWWSAQGEPTANRI